MTWVVDLPLFIETGVRKRKKYYMNLNAYKQWHHKESNSIKRIYTMQVGKLLNDLPKFNKIKLKYTIHYPTQRKYDVDNIGAVTSKFFQDTLVTFEKIDDDNFEYIPEITYQKGNSDKENPRVTVEIEEIADESL